MNRILEGNGLAEFAYTFARFKALNHYKAFLSLQAGESAKAVLHDLNNKALGP